MKQQAQELRFRLQKGEEEALLPTTMICDKNNNNNNNNMKKKRQLPPPSLGLQASQSFVQVERSGEAAEPLRFPPPRIDEAICVDQLQAWDPQTGMVQRCHNVVLRTEHHAANNDNNNSNNNSTSPASFSSLDHDDNDMVVAYWPRRDLQKAIFGSVWMCLVLKRRQGRNCWEITSEKVAIKKLDRSMIEEMSGSFAEDPMDEISAMQLLRDDNNNNNDKNNSSTGVVTCTEVLQDDDYIYSVMPYCSNGDLFGIVYNYAEYNNFQYGMPETVARHCFRQILWGLHHLQTHGICHRDLSLENILVDGEDFSCQIIDFGMCLRIPYNDPKLPVCCGSGGRGGGGVTDVTHGSVRRLMTPQVTCGKWKYMSPEVKSNEDNMDGFAVDLWSVGVILYIMLTGFHPYDQASRIDPRYQSITDGYLVEQLEAWGVTLSSEAGDLLQAMLQEDPRARLTLAEVMTHPWVSQGKSQVPKHLIQEPETDDDDDDDESLY